MISVIATIELIAGTREKFLQEFQQIVPKVRAEAGCLEYGPWVDRQTDIGTQQPLRADTVVVIEKWTDMDALKAHLNAPHMLEYRPRVKDLVSCVTLEVLEAAP